MQNKNFETQRRDLLIETLREAQSSNEKEIDFLKAALKDADSINSKLLGGNSLLKAQLLSGCALLQVACAQLKSLEKIQAG